MSTGTRISNLPSPQTNLLPTNIDYFPGARGTYVNGVPVFSTMRFSGASFLYNISDAGNYGAKSILGSTSSSFNQTNGTTFFFKQLSAQAPIYITTPPTTDLLNFSLGYDNSLYNNNGNIGVKLLNGGGLKLDQNGGGIGVSYDSSLKIGQTGALGVAISNILSTDVLQPLLTATSPLTYNNTNGILQFGLPYNSSLYVSGGALSVQANRDTGLVVGDNGLSLTYDDTFNIVNYNLGLNRNANSGFATVLSNYLSSGSIATLYKNGNVFTYDVDYDNTLKNNNGSLGVNINSTSPIVLGSSGIQIQYDNTLAVKNNVLGLNTAVNGSSFALLSSSINAYSPLYIAPSNNQTTLTLTLSTDLSLYNNNGVLSVNFDPNYKPFRLGNNGLMFNYGDALDIQANILNLNASPNTTFNTLMSATLSSRSFRFFANNRPTVSNELANKDYVDQLVANANGNFGNYVLKSGSTITGNLSSSVPPGNSVELTNKAYVDQQISSAVKTTILTSTNTFNDSSTINFTVNGDNVVTANFVGSTSYLPLAGGTLTGPVNIDANLITTNASYTPKITTYALVNKQYVDQIVQSLFTQPAVITAYGPTSTVSLTSYSPLPPSTASYRVDLNGVTQDPINDYTVSVVFANGYYTTQLDFTTPVLANEKVVVVANVSPTVGSTYNPTLDPQSLLANPTGSTASGTSFAVLPNHVVANLGSGLTTLGLNSTQQAPYQFVGNVTGNIAAVSLIATNGITLTNSSNTLKIDGTVIQNQIGATNSNVTTVSGDVIDLSKTVDNLSNAVAAASIASKVRIINSPATSYIIGSNSDSNTTIGMNNSSANTVYVPSNINTLGYEVNIIQLGTGTTTIIPQPGAVINQPYNQFKLAQQYSAASLICMGSFWVLYGDLKV